MTSEPGSDGPRHGRSGPPVRRARNRRGLIAGRVVIGLVAVLVLTATGWEWSIKARADQGIADRSVQAVTTDDSNLATPTVTSTTVYAPENILLLGSDTRSGANNEPGVSDGSTDGVANSDTLMLAHISGDRQHVTVLSIPRDTWVKAPQCNSWNSDTGKISDQPYQIKSGEEWHVNWAYSVGGPQCTVKAVQGLTGLKINRVIGIDFAGFKNMVDALGGITVNVCSPIVDSVLGTVVPTAGVQTVVGDQALSLVRAREVIGDKDSDLARIRRQQVVLSALLQQVTSAGTLLNPTKLDAFLQAFVQNTFTDNVTIDDLVTLAQSFGDLSPSKVTFYTLPTVPSQSDPDALDVDETKAPAVFQALLNDQPLPGEPAATSAAPTPTVPSPDPSAATASSSPAPVTSGPVTATAVDPSGVDLRIVNSTGRPGTASTVADELSAYGFSIPEDNLVATEQVADFAAVVEYPTGGTDPAADLATAATVAAAVPGAVLVPVAGTAGVRLVLGQEFDGTVRSVSAGSDITGTVDPSLTAPPVDDTGAASASQSPVSSLNSTDLQSVNAGQALCA
ncbi:LytR family transcriptional regulator [Nakamurella flava]|uniref:LytR family transcriptional regulator n=1 Tax=Nakamurella flava TaxID=2576308 RepID=A0A4U6QCA9_9ACTN|nr:LCP family protein [Nakamurella flava]TKV57650.1 LytR family transcriptional regulator [Nakamurella flava]